MTPRRHPDAAARLLDDAAARLEALDRGAPLGLAGRTSPLGPLERRRFLAAGGSALAAALLAGCNSFGPRSARGLLELAERANEHVERWLLRHTSMDHAPRAARIAGRSFPAYHISRHVPVWDERRRGPWRLEIAGLVERPLRLSLDDLVRLPAVQQRVNHYCVEGWTAVATWWGVRVRDLARLAGARPEAQYVDFQSFDADYHESWDLESATHPQTLVAYARDGRYLPPAYGAPARLHSPVKLGYKCTKYLTRVVFMAERNGGYWSDRGYEWYAGT
ncbi:MAG TPA: molybdopterin-dependent oxidoreductase [Gemmatimonadaceae bacterium]|nr:molybdopterin-dependent oxidoreductase [Gemmatimonadaceae bacterium]